MREERRSQRRRTYLASRSIICLVVAGSLGSLLWTPANALLYGLDVLVRTYLVFLGTVMAHEGVHGHLGSTRRANFGWGRIALIPGLLPFTNFRNHKRPQLSWIELESFVQPASRGSWGGLIPRRDIKAMLLILGVLLGFSPSPADAQFPWRTLSTPGYAVGGLVAAAGPAFSANSIESGVTVFGIGLVGGVITGWVVGGAAEERLARGEALPGWHKNALRTGTVLTGAGVGALVSFLAINGDAGGGEGAASDEAIFGGLVAGGAVLGALTQVLLESRLEPVPARAGLGLGHEGQPALVLTLEL